MTDQRANKMQLRKALREILSAPAPGTLDRATGLPLKRMGKAESGEMAVR